MADRAILQGIADRAKTQEGKAEMTPVKILILVALGLGFLLGITVALFIKVKRIDWMPDIEDINPE